MPQIMNINGQEIDVEQFRNDWALALMSQGVIVKLSVSRWRATTSLTSQDLGLKFSDAESANFMKKYIQLGKQKLLPPEIIGEIDSVECRARRVLGDYSFDTVWGKFVPNTAFEDWKRENDIIRADFFEAARVLGLRYDEILRSVKVEYKNLARDVWMRLYPNDGGGPTESFIENFVSKVISKVPTREDIISSFKYETTYFIIPMPSIIEDNIATAQETRRQTEMSHFNNQLEIDTKRRIADEYVQRKKELIDGFLESTVKNMRQYVAELCEGVLESIGKKAKVDKITLRDINKLKKMIKKVGYLNFHDDTDIATLLNDLEIEIDKFKGERDDKIVVGKLKEIVDAGTKEFIPDNFNPAISYLEV